MTAENDSQLDEQYMREALREARLSYDEGEFPVGCVLVKDGEIISRGRRTNTLESTCNEIDHAEIVALRGLIKRQPGVDCSQITMYSTMEPCLMCYSTMLLSGIRSFVWAYEDIMGGGANLPLYMLSPLYAGMQVVLRDRVLRRESLSLFQQFFTTSTYWQDSLLSRYTLAQPLE